MVERIFFYFLGFVWVTYTVKVDKDEIEEGDRGEWMKILWVDSGVCIRLCYKELVVSM